MRRNVNRVNIRLVINFYMKNVNNLSIKIMKYNKQILDMFLKKKLYY